MTKIKEDQKAHREKRKEYTYNKLKGLGQEIIEDIEKNKVPSVRVPSRGTGNIVYDEAKRYYYDIAAVNENNAKKNIQDYIPKDVIIKIQKQQRDIKKRKDFSFLDEDN